MTDYTYDAQIVKTHWCIEISTAAQYGMANNAASGVLISLWFYNNELIDFYGVDELPPDVSNGIKELGFFIDEEEFV